MLYEKEFGRLPLTTANGSTCLKDVLKSVLSLQGSKLTEMIVILQGETCVLCVCVCVLCVCVLCVCVCVLVSIQLLKQCKQCKNCEGTTVVLFVTLHLNSGN